MLTFIIFFSGAGFPEPAGQERTIVRFQVSQQEGEEREQLFGIYRKKSGEEPPIRSPNNYKRKSKTVAVNSANATTFKKIV
jgi:hypothetical protein